ncbi:hypothetical protein CSTERLE_08830 [Thermoclostridium stercorarium subsp. leptospartum DSM 9219]|uniref:ABC transporter substrate-binding protein n=1 Tax=Thermoclostridium stercorarium subsp. leptospartum DSM 9219 TaxID=1346611 RepID=A0A1B1YLN5_THEST|nr:extracellular solute-binding protein [Thermoclostridium stercorarium]ANX01675.1 hypothetical protein CSTERLE_08830 [Thermoclostridium stercorarium subsp. leptospartum DSM 9219]
MKKRFLSLALAMILMACAFAGCEQKGQQASSVPTAAPTQQAGGEAAPEDKYAKELTITVARRGDSRAVEEDLFSPYVKEKFNIVFEITDINNNDFVTKMNLLLASGEAPDINLDQRPEFMLNEWIQAGYFRGYTQEEIKNLMPNYYAQYTEEEWKSIWPAISYFDGKSYYFPSRRASSIDMAWLYREDIFNKLNLKFPTTTDGLLEVMRTLKKETGKVPYVSANSGDVLWAFTGFLQVFGIPELAPRELSYVDPVSGEFVPYAFTTDTFRQHVIFMNKLYEEGLIWQEFATGTTDQVNAAISQGNHMIAWSYPSKIESELNRLSRNENPEASWVWAKDMPSSNPERATYFKANPYYNASGVGFSADASDEVIERFMAFMDWLHTDEGMVFRTYGIEGVTYRKEGNNYVFMDHMASPLKSEGKTLTNYGFVTPGRQHPNLNEYYYPYLTELEKTFFNRKGYYHFIPPVMAYTDEESSELADITTSLQQTAREYYAKFIMGHLDAEDDKEWENYVSTMKKLGLDRFCEIRTTVYERSNR